MEADFKNKYIVFFDGECGVCNFWVQWVLEKDKKDRFLFASLQSHFGQKFLSERGLNTQNLDTIYLWKPQGYYLIKSKAIFKITSILGGVYHLFAFGRLLPGSISDFFYDIVAKNRMKITNQKCYLPTKEQKKKIIDL